MKIKNGHTKLNGTEQKRYERIRKQIFDSAGWRCECCGRPGALELHHKKAIHKGGDFWDENNMEVLCRLCHIKHHQLEKADAIKGKREWLNFLRQI